MLAEKLREIAELLDYIPADEVSRGVLATLSAEVKRLLALADYADGRVLVKPRSEFQDESYFVLELDGERSLARDDDMALEFLQNVFDQRDGRVLPE